ncbi:hypothetical protein NL449_27640, partial [Klebsiella pneumoniae]|nr:hypothetical protein [Klebsiella pneumoniae]
KLSFHKIKPDEGIWIDPDDFTASEPPNYGFKAPRKERGKELKAFLFASKYVGENFIFRAYYHNGVLF